MRVYGSILDSIGGTGLVPLRTIVPASGARVLLKLESENPTGSMKDRMALAMIDAAEADGRVAPGGAVVEYTGGSTGVSLALVCAVRTSAPYRLVGCVRAGETRSHARATVRSCAARRHDEQLTAT